MRIATKVRLYPTPDQQQLLVRPFGAVRFVYNKALAIISHRYKVHGQSLRAAKDIKPLLAVAKRSRKYAWLKEHDAIALQQACRNLDTAFKNFFDPSHPARYPYFKGKHGKQSSYHCTGSTGFDADSITLPKIGQIPAVIHRDIRGELKSITLTKTVTGKYFASILVENAAREQALLHEMDLDAVRGVDVGLAHMLTDDMGEQIDNHRHLQRADASWHSLTEKLVYKAARSGKHLVKIDQWFASSKICSCCGEKVDSLPLSVRARTCACGAVHDRDTNAAINIRNQGILKLKAAGHVVTAHGGLCKTGTLPAAA